MPSKVVGEGTYGCVHKPPLKCKDKRTPRKNKTSKVMLTKHAITEMKEYDLISSVDKKNNYHLGKPIHCKIDPNRENISAILRCKNKTKYLQDPELLSLLIMKDGGENVEQFSERMKTQGTQALAEHFWIDFYNIWVALDLFDKKGIVHHDMKPQNIMYDADTHEMKIIDFGLMTTMDKIKASAEQSKYPFPVFHWSFPFEMAFYNKNTYDHLFASNKTPRLEIFNRLMREFQSPSSSNEDVGHIKTFFHYMRIDGYPDSHDKQLVQQYWRDYYIFLNSTPVSHKHFIEFSSKTIDIYGAAIAMATAFSATHRYLSDSFRSSIVDFMYEATHPNIALRLTPHAALVKYKSMLEGSGLLAKYGVSTSTTANNNIPVSVSKEINSIQLKNVSITPSEVNKIVNQSLSKCPDDKEMNPKTGRCNKRCKDGYIRNSDFKCVSSRANQKINANANANANVKGCPPGKEMNPKTRRCNNVCKPGYVRNADFKCVKNKTQKLRS